MYPTKVSIANNKGFESITAISRAFEVGTPAEGYCQSTPYR